MQKGLLEPVLTNASVEGCLISPPESIPYDVLEDNSG